jgi:ribosome modulation factor
MKHKATISIATPETDALLSKEYGEKGHEAKLAGKTREDCPYSGGKVRDWWLEGFDGISMNTNTNS